jgi:hypothetical protein
VRARKIPSPGASLVIESRKSFFHGEFVTKMMARVLFVLFVLGLSVPVVAQTNSTAAVQATPAVAKADTGKAKPDKAKKSHETPVPPPDPWKSMKKYQKQQKKNQGKLLKAQAKAQKNMMKQQVGR